MIKGRERCGDILVDMIDGRMSEKIAGQVRKQELLGCNCNEVNKHC